MAAVFHGSQKPTFRNRDQCRALQDFEGPNIPFQEGECLVLAASFSCSESILLNWIAGLESCKSREYFTFASNMAKSVSLDPAIKTRIVWGFLS